MPSKTTPDLESERLVRKYSPLLVLYPEIEDGSRRSDHHRSLKPDRPPLDQDYHPRDIRLILDHACLPSRKGRPSRETLLDRMSDNSVSHIDLIDRGGPKEVDKFWRVYADVRDKDANPDYQRKAYARVVRGSGRFEGYTSIQYWLAYFFDDWANVHEMDWEMVSIVLKTSGSHDEPIACVFNAHVAGFRKPWADVHKVNDRGNMDPKGLHPVAYIANGSHAAYFSDYPPYRYVAECYVGSVLGRVAQVSGIAKAYVDYVPSFEGGAKCFPEVELVPEPDGADAWSGDWRWLNFKGNWGSPVQMSFTQRVVALIPGLRKIHLFFERPLREAGPPGPNAKVLCWENPFTWIDVECMDAPKTGSWLEEKARAVASP